MASSNREVASSLLIGEQADLENQLPSPTRRSSTPEPKDHWCFQILRGCCQFSGEIFIGFLTRLCVNLCVRLLILIAIFILLGAVYLFQYIYQLKW